MEVEEVVKKGVVKEEAVEGGERKGDSKIVIGSKQIISSYPIEASQSNSLSFYWNMVCDL